MMGNASERIWATMMDPDCARSGTFVDCAEYPIKPNADAIQYMPVDLAPAPSWQPIETAPKDGTKILAAWVPVNMPRWVRENILWLDGKWVVTWSHEPILSCPTHWMPLPAPPEAS